MKSIPQKNKIQIKGKVWCGFIGECAGRCPCYLIPKPGDDGVFICNVLRKFARKEVRITIESINSTLEVRKYGPEG